MKCRECGIATSGNPKWCPSCGARQITTGLAIALYFIAYCISFYSLSLVIVLRTYSPELNLIIHLTAPVIAGIIVLIIIFHGNSIEKRTRRFLATNKKSTK
jgi:hypothetical protein